MKPASREEVLALMESYMTAAALCAAMELHLFWLLDRKPLSVNAISKTLEIPLNRCRLWLDTLKNTGLLEENDQGYVASGSARSSILDTYSKEAWALLGQFEREQFPAIFNISESIHDPESTWAKQGLEPPEYIEQMIESPERARRFTRMLCELHLDMADEFAGITGMTGVKRMMDLGGGSGVMSMALLRMNPGLSSVVIDMENVCMAGREIAKEQGLSDRMSYHTANFLEDDLPGRFDLILECDLGIHSVDLFRKLYGSLNPGGRLVLIDLFAPEEGRAPTARLQWAFRDSLDDHTDLTATAQQVQGQLTQAGFELMSESEISGGWAVIEACR